MSNIPTPSQEYLDKSNKLLAIIIDKIKKQGNIRFSEYMNLALYHYQYGYYTSDNLKIGFNGDFITAPNLTSLFGKTLAIQIKEILPQVKQKNIYEFGAGTGKLAVDILNYLDKNEFDNYYLIDISNDLIKKQEEYIKQNYQYPHKVKFLNKLPNRLNGVIIGNEVLDAIPFDLIKWDKDEIFEQRVSFNKSENKIELISVKTENQIILKEAYKYNPNSPISYQSEIHLQQQALIKTIIDKLDRGISIFVDYGFNASQYYHIQRFMGTMIGHFKHHTINDPFLYPGLVDITTHINFSAIADTIIDNNAELLGYINQSNFLINLGILDLLALEENIDENLYLRESNNCKILLNPSEMGELFKVICFGKNINQNLRGFSNFDIRHKL